MKVTKHNHGIPNVPQLDELRHAGDEIVSEGTDAEGYYRITFVRIFEHPHWGWEIKKVERTDGLAWREL